MKYVFIFAKNRITQQIVEDAKDSKSYFSRSKGANISAFLISICNKSACGTVAIFIAVKSELISL